MKKDSLPPSTPLSFFEMPLSVRERVFLIAGIALLCTVGFIITAKQISTYIAAIICVVVAIVAYYLITEPFKSGQYYMLRGQATSVVDSSSLKFVKPLQNFTYTILLVNDFTGEEFQFTYASNNVNLFKLQVPYNFYFDTNYKLIGYEMIR